MSFAPKRARPFRTLMHLISGYCRGPLQRGSRQNQADRYAKRYRSADLALALISHFLIGTSSLRQLRMQLVNNPILKRHIGMGCISDAQLPKLLQRRPSEIWAPLIQKLLASVNRHALPSHLRVFDSSFFSMSMQIFSRCQGRDFKAQSAGIKLGLVLDPQSGAPAHWVCRVGHGADNALLDELIPPDAQHAGLLYLFDRGFRNYAFFQRLIDSGADLITRAAANTHWTLIEELPLDAKKPQIIGDQRVRLGSHNGHNLMASDVRRIELKTAKETIVFLTSCFDPPAHQVCKTYRRRWEIETFFRWLKRTIGCAKPLGNTTRAAEHTICAAIVAYLLVLLFERTQPVTKTDQITPRIQAALTRTRALLCAKPQRHQLRALGFT